MSAKREEQPGRLRFSRNAALSRCPPNLSQWQTAENYF